MSRMKVHRTTQEWHDIINGYKLLIEVHQKEIWELKKFVSENEKNKNLLQGYKKVIEDLSRKLSQKDS
jgi:hypothetical protein